MRNKVFAIGGYIGFIYINYRLGMPTLPTELFVATTIYICFLLLYNVYKNMKEVLGNDR